MGRVKQDTVADDTSDDERRKTVREEKKVRTKKKKRKRDLTDLHQRLFKSRKQNRQETCKVRQSSYVKLLQHFASTREEYDKEVKIDGKLGKQRNSGKTSNRILPRPCTGIYLNGAIGKEIRRSQTQLPLNSLNNARLGGNVVKLLHGYDSKSRGVVIENDTCEDSKDPLLDSTIKNILQPTPSGVQCTSPVLGKVDGKKKLHNGSNSPSFIDVPQRIVEKQKATKSENLSNFALNKYEELCKLVSAENFEGRHFSEQFPSDPLTTVKRKLRTIYAESFHNQFLRDMVKRGTVLSEYGTPSTSVGNEFTAESAYCPSRYIHEEGVVSVTIENSDCRIGYQKNKPTDLHESRDTFLVPESNCKMERKKKNEIPSSNLLFDLTTLNNVELKNVSGQEVTKVVESTGNDSADVNSHSSMEVHRSIVSKYKNNNAKYIEPPVERIKERNKFSLFLSEEMELPEALLNKRHMIKRKSQRTQTIHDSNGGFKKCIGKQNVNNQQQVKTKNLKHIPAILRRCSNPVTNNSAKFNLFEESMHVKESNEMLFNAPSKQNVLFSPKTLLTEFHENSKRIQTSNSDSSGTSGQSQNIRTCVVASPSLRNDNASFLEKHKRLSSETMDAKEQTLGFQRKDIFVKKNPSVQKTVMFTKKDTRNIGHCLHLNGLINDGTTDDSNVYIVKKNVPVQQERLAKSTCMLHRNCCKSFSYLQNSRLDTADSNYGSQEFNESSQVQKPVVYEKVLLRRVQQHSNCENNQKCEQHVCYVVVDKCKDSNNARKCSNDNVSQLENSRILQGAHFCRDDIADVGILKGVQNLKILPVEEQESQMKFVNNRCTENAVIFEQPVKYLAFENDSKAQKVPIYVQKNKCVSSADNVEIINSNYRVVSCPQEPTQKVIFVPACEKDKIVYVKEQDLGHSHVSFEECSHPGKVLFYRPDVQRVQNNSNLYEIHVPPQNVMEIRKSEYDASNLQQADSIKKLRRGEVNREELHYRPRREHSLLNDACARSQAVFYQK